MNIYLGNKDGNDIYEKLGNLKNVLIAGGPGGGKTVYLTRIIKELTSKYSSNDIKFVIYDSKMVDYWWFNESPYLLFPITTDETVDLFKKQFKELKDIAKKRIKSKENNPAIIVLIDEFYTLYYLFKDCIKEISLLAKESDKTNIHFFISSQRPCCFGDELNKAIDSKISYWLFDEEESKYFLGVTGAQYLEPCGDAIVLINGKLESLKQKRYKQ